MADSIVFLAWMQVDTDMMDGTPQKIMFAYSRPTPPQQKNVLHLVGLECVNIFVFPIKI